MIGVVFGWGMPVLAGAVAVGMLLAGARSSDSWWWRCCALCWAGAGLFGMAVIVGMVFGLWPATGWAGAAIVAAAAAVLAGTQAGGAVATELAAAPAEPPVLVATSVRQRIGEDFLP